MTEREILADLTTIVRDVLMNDDVVISRETSARDVPGWDSFKMIEIVMAVEGHFGVSVPSKKLDSMETVGDLVELIETQKRVDA